MEHASSIIKKGYDTFSKLKLRGGAPGESEEPYRWCPICLNNLENGSLIIHPIRCPMHKAHSACLRSWWRRNPTCPICRTPGHLPPLLPEEEEAEQQADQQLQQLQQQQDAEHLQMQQQMQREIEALLLETNLLLNAQQMTRGQMHPLSARFVFIFGLFASVLYNLEYIMEMVDLTMGAVMISMFLLAFLGSN